MLTLAQKQMINTAVIDARDLFHSLVHTRNAEVLIENANGFPLAIVCPDTRHDLHLIDIVFDSIEWPRPYNNAQNQEIDTYIRSLIIFTRKGQ